MRINVSSKVGVVNINFLVWTRSCRRDRVLRFSRYSPSTSILIALYPTGIYSFDFHVTRWNTFGIGCASSEALIKAPRIKVYRVMCKVYRAVRKSRVKAGL